MFLNATTFSDQMGMTALFGIPLDLGNFHPRNETCDAFLKKKERKERKKERRKKERKKKERKKKERKFFFF